MSAVKINSSIQQIFIECLVFSGLGRTVWSLTLCSESNEEERHWSNNPTNLCGIASAKKQKARKEMKMHNKMNLLVLSVWNGSLKLCNAPWQGSASLSVPTPAKNPRFGSLGLEGEKVWEYYASSGQLLYFPLFSAFSSPELSPWEGEAAGPPSSQPESLLLPSTRTQHQNLIGGRKFLKRSTPIHSAGREIVSGIQTSGRGRRTLCGSQGPRARS